MAYFLLFFFHFIVNHKVHTEITFANCHINNNCFVHMEKNMKAETKESATKNKMNYDQMRTIFTVMLFLKIQ